MSARGLWLDPLLAAPQMVRLEDLGTSKPEKDEICYREKHNLAPDFV